MIIQEYVVWLDISMQDARVALVMEIMKSGPYALHYFVPIKVISEMLRHASVAHNNVYLLGT